MPIKLLHNLVAVRELDTSTTTASGIQLVKPEKSYRGVVVTAGPGRFTEKGVFVETTVIEGDEVLFARGAGEPTEIDGETLLVMTEENIVGILK